MDSDLLPMDLDPDPAMSLNLQDASFLLLTFLKVHLHPFSKIKSHKESQKQTESRFFFTFFA